MDTGFAPAPAVVAHLLASSLADAVARTGASLRWRGLDHQPAPTGEEAEAARRLSRHPGTHPIHLAGTGPVDEWFGRLAAAADLPLVIGDVGRAGSAALPDWVVLLLFSGMTLALLMTAAVLIVVSG